MPYMLSFFTIFKGKRGIVKPPFELPEFIKVRLKIIIFRTEFCYCNTCKFTDTCTYIFLWYLSGMEICFCFLDDMIPTPIRITIFVSPANL